MKTPDVVTLTINPTVDKSCRVESVAAERKLRCQDVVLEPGGGGINVSRALARLGSPSRAIFPSGGPTGQLLRQLLGEEELDHLAVDIEQNSRENLIVYEESSDRQYRFGMPGARMARDEWTRCLDLLEDIEEGSYVVLSGSLPPGVPDDFYAQAVDRCWRRKSRAVVDTSGAALRSAAERGVYLLKPNLREFGELAGTAVDDEAQQEEAAGRLLREGVCELLLVSLGAAGILLATKEGMERIASPSVRIRSRVGAGDSTVAGIVLGLVKGWSPRRAACLGVSAGAAAVMTPGTQLCRRDDTERLFRRMCGLDAAPEAW